VRNYVLKNIIVLVTRKHFDVMDKIKLKNISLWRANTLSPVNYGSG